VYHDLEIDGFMFLKLRLFKLATSFILIINVLTLTGCVTPPTGAGEAVIAIDQVPRGVHLRLANKVLSFEFDKADLDITAAAPYLDRIAALIITKSAKLVAVEGYTDNIGSLTANQALSEARAKAVSDALQVRGVPAERLKAEGFSLHRPIMSNNTEEGRALNRRVEIVILDETVEHITREEAADAFESAFAKLKNMVDQGVVKPLATPEKATQ
jgi:flagellar motor protein MotB